MSMTFRHIAVLVALLAWPAQQTFKISAIDAKGTKRLSVADVAQVSGLKVGQSVTPADLDEVDTRMAECGLFKQVSYQFSTKGSEIAVAFSVEEQPWDTPVVYDNFVGIPDAELTKAIRAEVPTYDGTAPGNGLVPLISHALAGVIKAHGLTGTIDYRALGKLGSSGDVDAAGRSNVFSVRPGPPLCAIHIDGAAQVPEAEVVLAAKSSIDVDYSRHQLELLVRSSFPQAYHEHGYWKATLTTPVAATGTSGTCQGVVATVHVDEGPTYTWNHLEWTGNNAMPESDLNSIVAVKAGSLAESRRLESGLFAVESAHHKLGYLTARAKYEPVLDDAARTVTVKVSVAEGPQFRMGTVRFVGIPASEATALAAKWKLKAGEPFDDSVRIQFEISALAAYRAPHNFVASRQIDPATHVVDVTYTLK
jgi:outer membrane protein assembly factor BamA